MTIESFVLRCLGAPELARPDGTPVRFRTRKHLALLLFLAHERPLPHRRERLAAFLWPRTGALEARHSLATALSELRGRLGRDLFSVTRDTIQLVPGTVTTDVATLLDGTMPEEVLAASGLFLEEFDVPDAEDFQLWRDGCRMTLTPLQCRLAMERLVALRRQGRPDAMERWARFLWRLDPLNEDGVRAVVEARALTGDRVGALRSYTRWRERLAHELGALPSRATEQLAERLRRGLVVKEHVDAPATPAIARRDDDAPIGRDEPLVACEAAWQDATRGTPSCLMLHGPPGSGRSSLLRWLRDGHALRGAAVVHAAMPLARPRAPFDAVAMVAAPLLDLPGAGTVAPDHLTVLVALVPAKRTRYAALPPAPPLTTVLVAEALVALLAAIGEERPLLLLIDDVDRADAPSLAVFTALPIEAPARCLVVATALRPIGLPERNHVIAPLDAPTARTLLARWWRREAPPPCVVDALIARAAGHPATLRHIADEWNATGDAPTALFDLALSHDEGAVATALRLLAAPALEGVDEHARMIGLVAAMLGDDVDLDRCSRLTELPLTIVVRTLSRMVVAGILDAPPSGHRFASPTMRAWCYFSAAASLRARIHATVLAAARQERGACGPLDRAWHAFHAGADDEGMRWLRRGVREALATGATTRVEVALRTLLRRDGMAGAERCVEWLSEIERRRREAA